MPGGSKTGDKAPDTRAKTQQPIQESRKQPTQTPTNQTPVAQGQTPNP